jgi:uncharacterized membrane protein
MAGMALTLEQPWLLLLWPLLAALLVAVALVRRPQNLLGLVLRLAMMTLLVLGLANPVPVTPVSAPRRQVILVDRSASIHPEVLGAVQQVVAASGASLPETIVVQFGAHPELVADPSRPADWPDLTSGDQATDLAAALDLAGQLLSGGGTVLLASDGAATSGDTLAAAERLAAAGITVDAWPVDSAPVSVDAAVEAVELPETIWTGEPFSVTVRLYALAPTPAQLEVTRDGTELAQVDLTLDAGENSVDFAVVAEAEGLSAFEARVTALDDGRPENDTGGGIAFVRPPPNVLIIARSPGAGDRLRAAMAVHQVQSTVQLPSTLPATLEPLLGYEALVLMDVTAEDLSFEQLATLEAFVYAQGRGLIVAGGQTSYSLGAYQSTPLERMLPVSLEQPERGERAPANLLLIIDRSGSMSPLKLALVKEAAMRAVEVLQPSDRVGVLAFDDLLEWRVPLTELGQGATLRGVLDSIARLTSRGGTDILAPLAAGMEVLSTATGGARHIVLLSDGESAVGTPEDFERLVAAGRELEITVSTIAVGDTADLALMENIAAWGAGRFHYATEPERIPQMMLAETQAVRSEAVQQGTIRAQITQPHPLVSDFNADELPPLEAYVALSERAASDAEVVLASPLDDPLLAAWQYGLGRVVAWTSDVGGDWSPAWAGWARLGQFWAQTIRYALPSPSQAPIYAQAAVDGRSVALTVLAAGADGAGLSLATGQLLLARPDGSRSAVAVAQAAPGQYEAAFMVEQTGAYRGLVTLDKGAEHWEIPVGFVTSYPAEFNARQPDGEALLHQIASLTGGRIVPGLPVAPEEAAAAAGPQRGYGPWLVLAALLFWPLDIALRRRYLPWK